ncbi:MAG TPA: DUF4350 domain-containing protein [Chthoniobacter sp.]|nr:DUF4350 domain-containing protein [Chthoniobacter sp.]
MFSLVLAIAFGWGLVRLFVLRYEVGDSYPPYSSLRADPLGTKALATALDELPDVEVRRNFKPLPKLRTNGPVTLVYAGVPHRAFWGGDELQAFNTLVLTGSRAVFTFYPVESPPSSAQDRLSTREEREKKQKKEDTRQQSKEKDAKDKKDDKSGKDAPADDKKKKTEKEKKTEKKSTTADHDDDKDAIISFNEVATRWGFSFDYLPEEKGKTYNRHAALIEPGGQMESDISWHSALYFRDLKPQWKVLYMCGTMPVVIERKYGSGSIVLVADSFLVSNEALRGERQPKLLSRIFSGPPTIIFDEDHNDLRENPGVASLARKYHLSGLIAGLVLLAAIFVWKNMVRFIPAYDSSSAVDNVVVGKESGEGFVNLLRRSIRPSAIFATCLAEWRKTFTGRARDRALVEEICAQEEARGPRDRDPVETYRAVSRAIARKI